MDQNVRLCPNTWTPGVEGFQPTCPSMVSRTGKPGDACSGYMRDVSGDVFVKDGTLRCDYCYGDERHRPWTNPIAGAACFGYLPSGDRMAGLIVCD